MESEKSPEETVQEKKKEKKSLDEQHPCEQIAAFIPVRGQEVKREKK